MHNNYLQMPPDSTGKKVSITPLWIIPVSNTTLFSKEDIIVGGTSNATMVVRQINVSSDYLYAKYTNELQEGGSWIVGENILVNGIVVDTVLSTPLIQYNNTTTIVSHDNPFNGQRIDAQGQAYFRYEEGAQILDSVGRTKTVLDNVIGAYKFVTLDCWDTYLNTATVGTASKTMDPYHNGLKLSTGTANNDAIKMMSNKYHMHIAGTGLYAEMLISVGDSGKNNLAREWGYADDANGLFFDLMGSELNVGIRNSSSGSPIDIHIPQSQWNRDKLDGTGISGITLDITKINKYWFDFHRGVRFRFGIYSPAGARIVCHDLYVANTNSLMALPSTSLPIRVYQHNTGAVISTSEMTLYEANVITEGEDLLHSHKFEAGGVLQIVTNAAWMPLVSIRPQTDSKHTIAMLIDIATSAVLASDANIDGRIKLEIFKNPTLTGATFATIKGDSRFEIDTAATAMTGGKAIIEYYIKGTESKDVEDHFSYLDEFLVQHIDGTKNIYTLGAKAIAADCSVIGAINWKEYFVR